MEREPPHHKFPTFLQFGDTAQLSLFADAKKEKERRLDQAMDSLRNAFGTDAVVRGAVYHSQLQVGKKYEAQLKNRRDGGAGPKNGE